LSDLADLGPAQVSPKTPPVSTDGGFPAANEMAQAVPPLWTTSWSALRSGVTTPVRSFWRAVGVGVLWLVAGIAIGRMLGLVLLRGSVNAGGAGVVCGELRAVRGALAGRARFQVWLGWDWVGVAHPSQR
jgi:hypothetical protein